MRCFVIRYIKNTDKDIFFVSSGAYDREEWGATVQWSFDILKAKRFATLEEAEAEIERQGWEGSKSSNEYVRELLGRAAVAIMVDLP